MTTPNITEALDGATSGHGVYTGEYVFWRIHRTLELQAKQTQTNVGLIQDGYKKAIGVVVKTKDGEALECKLSPRGQFLVLHTKEEDGQKVVADAAAVDAEQNNTFTTGQKIIDAMVEMLPALKPANRPLMLDCSWIT